MKSRQPLPSLTSNEQAVLRYIIDFVRDHSISPTFTEIQTAFGYSSVNSVQNYVRQLERKGYLSLEPHQKRALKVLAGPQSYQEGLEQAGVQEVLDQEAVLVPVEARVAAGAALEYRVYDRSIRVDKALLPRSAKVFAVEVQGDSMVEDGILSGDTLLVSKSSQLTPGMTAVVSLEEGATVKRLYPDRASGKIELRPANASYQSKFVDQDQMRIEGRVVGLIRQY